MKKALSSFLILFFAALSVSLSAWSQSTSERVQQTLRAQQPMFLTEIFRSMGQEARQLEVLSLTIQAQAYQGQAQLEVRQQGQFLGAFQVSRQMQELSLQLPRGTRLEGLEILAKQELYLESVSAQTKRAGGPQGPGPRPPQPSPQPQPYPQPQPQVRQPAPQSLITLQYNQDIRSGAEISLDRLALEQQGLTLSGAQIERVVVEGQPMGYGNASVQVELNRRLVGQEKFLAPNQARTPLQVQSFEEVQSLRLIVRGGARIFSISIRVGQVRQQPQGPRYERVLVQSEVSSGRPLELSRYLPYENRMVRSLMIEARTRYSQQAELALVTFRGEFLGSVIVSQSPMRPVIQLSRPMAVRDLVLQSVSPISVDSVEIEYDQSYPRH